MPWRFTGVREQVIEMSVPVCDVWSALTLGAETEILQQDKHSVGVTVDIAI